MHADNLDAWTHEHAFHTGNAAGERGTRWVMWITAAMMLVEIGAGWFYNSMALMADGFHMSSHAVAIGLSAFAYAVARRQSRDDRYAFGTWKIEILGGFTSAIFLLVVVALMVIGSVERLIAPGPIQYQEAMVIAVLGLLVNFVCAAILGKAHQHEGHPHAHGHDAGGHDHGHDLNLRAAYVHVVADAATSVLAILALAGGWFYGWSWLDPVMGIVGAVVVASWAKSLIAQTSKILLDREMDHPVVDEIRDVIKENAGCDDTRLVDLHVWRVGKGTYSCALSVVTHDRLLTPSQVRHWLSVHAEIVHSTIEIQRCT